ncbi:hypothetical protein MKW92_048924 [Papaver armeniacum]|nr:hypothetical protein MKW92_048924 [Papaver armeniacum]
MKNTNANCVHFLLFFSSLLFLTVSALTDEKNSILTGHTNPNDVEAIQLLIENYPSLWYLSTDDQDDPCLPEPYPWVNCSFDDTPRITALYDKIFSLGKEKTTLAIALGTLVPMFLIFLAICTYLYRIHRKRKAAAAAVQKNGTSEPAILMYGNTMSPNPLLSK